MTNNPSITNNYSCPSEDVIRLLSGKWKPQIFKIASEGPFRFNHVLRELPEASKQSISVALRELEEGGMLLKTTVKQKPLHIEYELTATGRGMLDVYRQVDMLANGHKH